MKSSISISGSTIAAAIFCICVHLGCSASLRKKEIKEQEMVRTSYMVSDSVLCLPIYGSEIIRCENGPILDMAFISLVNSDPRRLILSLPTTKREGKISDTLLMITSEYELAYEPLTSAVLHEATIHIEAPRMGRGVSIRSVMQDYQGLLSRLIHSRSMHHLKENQWWNVMKVALEEEDISTICMTDELSFLVPLWQCDVRIIMTPSMLRDIKNFWNKRE